MPGGLVRDGIVTMLGVREDFTVVSAVAGAQAVAEARPAPGIDTLTARERVIAAYESGLVHP